MRLKFFKIFFIILSLEYLFLQPLHAVGGFFAGNPDVAFNVKDALKVALTQTSREVGVSNNWDPVLTSLVSNVSVKGVSIARGEIEMRDAFDFKGEFGKELIDTGVNLIAQNAGLDAELAAIVGRIGSISYENYMTGSADVKGGLSGVVGTYGLKQLENLAGLERGELSSIAFLTEGLYTSIEQRKEQGFFNAATEQLKSISINTIPSPADFGLELFNGFNDNSSQGVIDVANGRLRGHYSLSLGTGLFEKMESIFDKPIPAGGVDLSLGLEPLTLKDLPELSIATGMITLGEGDLPTLVIPQLQSDFFNGPLFAQNPFGAAALNPSEAMKHFKENWDEAVDRMNGFVQDFTGFLKNQIDSGADPYFEDVQDYGWSITGTTALLVAAQLLKDPLDFVGNSSAAWSEFLKTGDVREYAKGNVYAFFAVLSVVGPEGKDLTVAGEKALLKLVGKGTSEVIPKTKDLWLKVAKGESYVSPSGLAYKTGAREGHRLAHLDTHLRPATRLKTEHTIFQINGKTPDLDKTVSLVDEAWAKAKAEKIVPEIQPNGNLAYHVPMGKSVGSSGENQIRIVIKKDTTDEFVSAFPE